MYLETPKKIDRIIGKQTLDIMWFMYFLYIINIIMNSSITNWPATFYDDDHLHMECSAVAKYCKAKTKKKTKKTFTCFLLETHRIYNTVFIICLTPWCHDDGKSNSGGVVKQIRESWVGTTVRQMPVGAALVTHRTHRVSTNDWVLTNLCAIKNHGW